MRVTQVFGHLDETTALHGGRRFTEGARRRVRLGTERQRERGVGQVKSCLGQAHELDGPRARFGDEQSVRVRQAHVLTGEDDQTSREEARALTALEQRDEPVERGVGVRAANGLDQCAHLVVVRVGRLVVDAPVARLGNVLELHERGVGVRAAREDNRGVERGERRAGVAVGRTGQCRECVLTHLHAA